MNLHRASTLAERCAWADRISDVYVRYHDTEWGVPVHEDGKHFEFLILEGAQAGLSWSTVLNKREGYRKAFARFDPHKVARFSEKRVEALLKNPGIVRNRLKVRAAVTNAQAFLMLQEEFGSLMPTSGRLWVARPFRTAGAA